MSNPALPSFHVLIPAAGNGIRTGLSTPKQYAKIGGKAILRHTIEKFIPIQGLKSLRVIIDPAHEALYKEAVNGLDLPPPAYGSETRKQSIFNGLKLFTDNLDEEIILIHDAARPFVEAGSIYALLAAMEKDNAATLVSAVADTLVDPAYNRLDRDRIRSVQTPQAFRLGLIRKAHEQFADDNSFTDDAGLIAAMGGKIAFIAGSHENFKITSAGDMAMAEKLLAERTETRTGLGYDVHAFDPAPADTIRLGGIDIPHERRLLGHSDADVVLHALTDAILGTIGEGDIGQLFPPSDMQWKNADSAVFLTEALRLLTEKNGKLIHADIVLVAEEPKIGPQRERMLERLSALLGLTRGRIGLKATTSERLGFVGKGEGIACHAVVSVTLPA
ncbi:MAG: 2-C-methyl-D-erythritol 4-phosphate cytidylyltransferase [Micavibrio sp.]